MMNLFKKLAGFLKKRRLMKVAPSILSLDAETNGLWGQAFAIGAILYDGDGKEIARFIGRCPINGRVNEWVAENVLPQMKDVVVTHKTYPDLLRAFMAWRAVHRGGTTIEIVHVGVPVEARLFQDAHQMSIIGDWDAPYPLVDIAAIPEIGLSVDSYNAVYGISPSPDEFSGGTHNPLYDSAAAAIAYRHWLKTPRLLRGFRMAKASWWR